MVDHGQSYRAPSRGIFNLMRALPVKTYAKLPAKDRDLELQTAPITVLLRCSHNITNKTFFYAGPSPERFRQDFPFVLKLDWIADMLPAAASTCAKDCADRNGSEWRRI